MEAVQQSFVGLSYPSLSLYFLFGPISNVDSISLECSVFPMIVDVLHS